MLVCDLTEVFFRVSRRPLVHSESDEARSFYRHLVPDFEPSPTDTLHFVLLMKDIRRTLRR